MTRFATLDLDSLDRQGFIEAFAGVYEHSSWIAAQTWDRLAGAELASLEAVHAALSETLLRADPQRQLALIQAHPDLAGKAAMAGQLTPASSEEQAGAGLHLCTAAEFARFTEMNQAYRARFGFPFIMAVKGSDRHRILAAFEARLPNSPAQEVACALAEINKIALFRLQAL
jgi:2-oxo-4-hydroxy-4-carboxy-5-ureidoimidazoline decarboxylase